MMSSVTAQKGELGGYLKKWIMLADQTLDFAVCVCLCVCGCTCQGC